MKFLFDRLAALRHSLGESQYKFGQRIGIPPQYIHSYETGKAHPRIKTLMTICETFHIPVQHFFDQKHTTTSNKITQRPPRKNKLPRIHTGENHRPPRKGHNDV